MLETIVKYRNDIIAHFIYLKLWERSYRLTMCYKNNMQNLKRHINGFVKLFYDMISPQNN